MKTLIAIPCMDNVPVEFMASMLNLRKTADTYYAVNIGSLIYDSRNSFVATAIEREYDRVMWFDSDMLFQPDMLELLNADMDNNGLDYVSGLYFNRRLPTAPVIYSNIEFHAEPNKPVRAKSDIMRNYPKNSMFEIAGSGFGCVLIKTAMMKDVWEHFGPPFDPITHLGEDLSFCYRAKQLGYKMWCDSRAKAGHIGRFIFDEVINEDTYMNQSGITSDNVKLKLRPVPIDKVDDTAAHNTSANGEQHDQAIDNTERL